ncbi:hypothetical protein Bca101_102040 [Brassica carinata]
MDGAEARPIPAAGQEPGLDDLPTPETAQPEVGSSGWKSTARRVVSVHSRALENRGPKAATPGRTHNRIRSPRIGSRAGLGVPVQPADCWRLLEPLTWRATASCRPGTDWERLFRAFPRRTANSELCSECQSEEIQPSALNHSQGNGLGRISGKEDPVELDSNELNENRNLVEQKGKSSLDSDFQYEYEPDNWLVAAKPLIATLLFDPSMSALPIIVKQNSPSVGLFTHQ